MYCVSECVLLIGSHHCAHIEMNISWEHLPRHSLHAWDGFGETRQRHKAHIASLPSWIHLSECWSSVNNVCQNLRIIVCDCSLQHPITIRIYLNSFTLNINWKRFIVTFWTKTKSVNILNVLFCNCENAIEDIFVWFTLGQMKTFRPLRAENLCLTIQINRNLILIQIVLFIHLTELWLLCFFVLTTCFRHDSLEQFIYYLLDVEFIVILCISSFIMVHSNTRIPEDKVSIFAHASIACNCKFSIEVFCIYLVAYLTNIPFRLCAFELWITLFCKCVAISCYHWDLEMHRQ